jgi:hypothetical protein
MDPWLLVSIHDVDQQTELLGHVFTFQLRTAVEMAEQKQSTTLLLLLVSRSLFLDSRVTNMRKFVCTVQTTNHIPPPAAS